VIERSGVDLILDVEATAGRVRHHDRTRTHLLRTSSGADAMPERVTRIALLRAAGFDLMEPMRRSVLAPAAQ